MRRRRGRGLRILYENRWRWLMDDERWTRRCRVNGEMRLNAATTAAAAADCCFRLSNFSWRRRWILHLLPEELSTTFRCQLLPPSGESERLFLTTKTLTHARTHALPEPTPGRAGVILRFSGKIYAFFFSSNPDFRARSFSRRIAAVASVPWDWPRAPWNLPPAAPSSRDFKTKTKPQNSSDFRS